LKRVYNIETMTVFFRKIRFGFIPILALFVLMGAGCQISARMRNLPLEIESVYVPMFLNLAYQPGLEEVATRSTIQAFLSDGRLNVVSPQNADVIVQCIIQEYSDNVRSTGTGDFPMMNAITARVLVKLYSPDDHINPLHVYKPFQLSRSYVSDTRRVTQTIPEDARDSLMQAVGQRVVLEVLTGDFGELKYNK